MHFQVERNEEVYCRRQVEHTAEISISNYQQQSWLSHGICRESSVLLSQLAVLSCELM